MMPVWRALAVPLLLTSLAACKDLPAVFEDVGSDPHPPRLALLAVGVGVPEEPVAAADAAASAGEAARGVTYFPPDAVVTIRPYRPAESTLALRVGYSDAGADLSSITVRDSGGPNDGTLTLPDFPGTSGTIEGTVDFDPNSLPGPHRLELWAEDEHGSRSAKIVFTVVVESY